jgi:RNA polymerase sigma factor (TIGR02999 family)
MSDVTRILQSIEDGDPKAAQELLPLVYDELRKLAAAKMAREKPGQTLQATALVHDAYIRLVDADQSRHWNSRGHFFGAAAEAMRRILVENARRKQAIKHGAEQLLQNMDSIDIESPQPKVDVIALNDAIDLLARTDEVAADLVKLRFFAGLSVDDCATVLGMPKRSVERCWAFSRSWLFRRLQSE